MVRRDIASRTGADERPLAVFRFAPNNRTSRAMLTQIRGRALGHPVRSLVRFSQREATTGWGRAFAYDQLQPKVVASHNLSAGRPCERRDPSPLAPKSEKRPL